MCCSIFSPAVGSRAWQESWQVGWGWEMGCVPQGGHRALGAPPGSQLGTAGVGDTSAEPRPRRVPQPCAGTAGTSDSSGGRARHGSGTAGEDEPVQAWPRLVSPPPHPFLQQPTPSHRG